MSSNDDQGETEEQPPIRGATVAFGCNIDARGKAARMKLGIRLVIISLILAALTYLEIIPTTLGWLATAASLGGGVFTIWESRKGWCVIRAMGFNTKI